MANRIFEYLGGAIRQLFDTSDYKVYDVEVTAEYECALMVTADNEHTAQSRVDDALRVHLLHYLEKRGYTEGFASSLDVQVTSCEARNDIIDQ